MRISSNPFRGIRPRSGLALLLVLGLAATAMLSGAAVADKPAQIARSAKNAPPGTAIAAARAIAGRFKAVAAADRKLRSKVAAAAARHKGVYTEDLAIFAAADGNVIYSTTLTAKGIHRRDGELISIRLRVVRVDRSTGAKTELLNKFNTYPLGIYARGGRVVLETARILPPKKSAAGAAEIAARTTLYSAKNTDGNLSALNISNVEIKSPSDEPCGRFPILGGISEAGEPLVADVESPCDAAKRDDIEDLRTTLRVWKNDGTRRDLADSTIGTMLFGSDYQLSGSKLLLPNPTETATSIKDLDTGVVSDLWSPGAAFHDIAVDGTVALIGLPAPQGGMTDGEFSGDYFARRAGSAGSSTTTNGVEVAPGDVPLEPGSPAGPPPKYPFVIFPGGNADDPVLVAPSSASVAGIKICGGNLFALDGLKGTSTRYDGEGPDGFAIYGFFQHGRFEVQLYDLQGHLVRKLLKTKPLALVDLGCNNDQLVLVSRQGKGFVATEIAP